MSNSLSVVIIAKNEEEFIEDAIKSAKFADEVLILDSLSTDNTVKIAKKLSVRVEYQDFLGFGPQKNRAVNLAKHNWIFVLDSDERIPSKLRFEITEILNNPIYDAYFVGRLNNFFGKYIKTCGLYPDYSIRLFNRTKGRFNEVQVHESFQTKGNVGKLDNHMIHHAYKNIDEFIDKQKYYASISNKEKNIFKALLSPFWTFFKLYILKLGFLDGYYGYIISKIYAKYTFWKYTK